MQKISGYRVCTSGVDARVCLLRPCGRAGQGCIGGKEGVGSTVTRGDSETTQEPSVQASTSAGTAGKGDHYRVDCRMQTYIFKEGMSRAETKDFTARVTYRVQANLNGGGEKNLGDILDDLNVPAYNLRCG
jgi:hypothetical protein